METLVERATRLGIETATVGEMLDEIEQLRDAVLDCNGVEMRDCYEVPKDQWEALIALAVGSVMDKASNVALTGNPEAQP